MSRIDFRELDVLTFDCYGTLVDWEWGITRALRPVLASHRVEAPDREILELYARFEPAIEEGGYRPYREVLREVVHAFGAHHGFEPTGEEERVLVDSIGDWPAFPDTVDSLRRFRTRYRIGVISNVDEALFERTAVNLQVRFDHVVTAERARAYKPDPRPFEVAIAAMATPPERVLHAAQSLFHDVAPARKLGFRCVWVNRRAGGDGSGATPEPEPGSDARPEVVVPDLCSLASLMGLR